MKKENVSYELMIDLISNIMKKYVDSNSIILEEAKNTDNEEVANMYALELNQIARRVVLYLRVSTLEQVDGFSL